MKNDLSAVGLIKDGLKDRLAEVITEQLLNDLIEELRPRVRELAESITLTEIESFRNVMELRDEIVVHFVDETGKE